jgi:trk system potassium uptake protein TrkA
VRVVVVGAGAVGSYLAERLANEGLEVVVIESNEAVAAHLQEKLDVLVLVGNGSSSSLLQEAKVGKAGLLIAVSNSDGVNILACHTARQLGVRRTVARIEDPELREGVDDLGVDIVIDPSEAAATELAGLVARSGVTELVPFAGGELVLVGGMVQPGSALVGQPLHWVRMREAHWGWVLAALVRHGETTIAHGHTVVEQGDHALLMVHADDVHRATSLLGLKMARVRRVVILGSTRLAELTAAELLADGLEVILVDQDAHRCRLLSGRYPRALTIQGDPTDPEVMGELDLSEGDFVLALTGWDEVNVLASLVAKALGASRAVARFNRLGYVSLLSKVGIDGAVSSRLLAATAILRFVRHGRVQQVATFADSDAEAIEIEVDGTARAVDRSVIELNLPPGVTIGGISRPGISFVPDGSTVIRAGDRLIFFSLPDDIADTAALFAGHQ